MDSEKLHRKFHIDLMGSFSATQTNPATSDSSVILLELLETSGLSNSLIEGRHFCLGVW